MARQTKTKTYEPDRNRFVFRATGIQVPTKGGGQLDIMHVSEQDAREWVASQTRQELEQAFLRFLGIEYKVESATEEEPVTDVPADAPDNEEA